MTSGPHRRAVLLFERSQPSLGALVGAVAEIGLDVVGRCSEPEKLLALARELRPDVVVMSLEASREDTALLRGVHASLADLDLVVVSRSDDEAAVEAALAAGASAYVVATPDGDDLATAIRLAFDQLPARAPVSDETRAR